MDRFSNVGWCGIAEGVHAGGLCCALVASDKVIEVGLENVGGG